MDNEADQPTQEINNMETKTTKLKARRMWANHYDRRTDCFPKERGARHMAENTASDIAVPVAVIPLDDVQALVNKVAAAIDNKIICGSLTDITRAALTAIGVLPRARKGRK
jgi:hypothetical protein